MRWSGGINLNNQCAIHHALAALLARCRHAPPRACVDTDSIQPPPVARGDILTHRCTVEAAPALHAKSLDSDFARRREMLRAAYLCRPASQIAARGDLDGGRGGAGREGLPSPPGDGSGTSADGPSSLATRLRPGRVSKRARAGAGRGGVGQPSLSGTATTATGCRRAWRGAATYVVTQ